MTEYRFERATVRAVTDDTVSATVPALVGWAVLIMRS